MLTYIISNFLDKFPKAKEIKEKINKWDLINIFKVFKQIKTFCIAKRIIDKTKGQHLEWEKIFVNNVTNKRLISKIHEQFIQPIIKKNPNPIEKWAEDLNRHFSKEGIQMVNRHRKNAQHHLSLEKCKLRPQWSITSHLPEWFLSKRTLITNVGKNAEKGESSYTAGENVNLCSHCGKQYGSFPKT